MNADAIIDQLIRREGAKFTDHPEDKGGPTKYGITLVTLSEARARKCTAQDVEGLSETEARAIYQQRYVQAPGFDKIANPELCGLLVDCGVLHGVGRAVRWLQEAVGSTQDGKLGDQTAGLANGLPARVVFGKVLCTRFRFVEDLDDSDPSQEKFEDGWTNRCCEFVMVLAGMA